MVEVGTAKGCPERDIHPEGAVVAIQGFVEFEVPTAGVEETMRDPDTVGGVTTTVYILDVNGSFLHRRLPR
jgi:hypothetical protein